MSSWIRTLLQYSSHSFIHFHQVSFFVTQVFLFFFLPSDSFCCHENFPEFQPRQTVQVSGADADAGFL